MKKNRDFTLKQFLILLEFTFSLAKISAIDCYFAYTVLVTQSELKVFSFVCDFLVTCT